jgi:hypothetical protein
LFEISKFLVSGSWWAEELSNLGNGTLKSPRIGHVIRHSSQTLLSGLSGLNRTLNIYMPKPVFTGKVPTPKVLETVFFREIAEAKGMYKSTCITTECLDICSEHLQDTNRKIGLRLYPTLYPHLRRIHACIFHLTRKRKLVV